MMNVCAQCGMYRADKIIDPTGPYAICPECGYSHPFKQLPLLIVAGASGTGKSTVCNLLLGKVNEAVLLDSDILWRPEFNTPETNYRDFFETWLRMCKNIGQSGRPVVMFGAGMGVPENIEPCIERRYFSAVYYLALICSEKTQIERLQQRPTWRGSGDTASLEAQVNFNRWFQTQAQHDNTRIETLDTTQDSVEQTAQEVVAWIRGKLILG